MAHLIFPDDVQTNPSDQPASAPQGRVTQAPVIPVQSEIDKAAVMIKAAKRPIIVVGHGACPMRDDITALAETLGTPVLTIFKAKRPLPDDHPCAGGVLGRSGTPIASWFMNEADLIIALAPAFSITPGSSAARTSFRLTTNACSWANSTP